jgi:hypothetical protein
MTEHEKKNINWVKVRGECSAVQMFEKLKLDIENDIKTRLAIRPDERYYTFRLTSSENSFTVLREGNRIGAAVAFFLADEAITVKQSDKILFTARVTLSDEGECVFKIGDKEYESWQVRKIALEDLFFIGF